MLFFEMFSGLPRQGPGDAESTRRALALVPGIGPKTRLLDVGCGTGLQTRVLAQGSPARIVAVDNHPPFVDELNRQARALGIGDRLEARVGDMRQLAFAFGAFDVVWAEGAIFVMGFETGLREWRRLLAPGGHLAVTEVAWTKPDPPPDCSAFWTQEYPAIRPVQELLQVVAECEYETVGHFPLPPSSWWDDYYRPLQHNVTHFRERHGEERDAQELADRVQREIDIWRAYSEFYSYEFFVMRVP
ncbi:MAG TPA: methyltransferase domain-containing protein [Vicinamibacteria bacterium]|nr:methyltransferase domain-containing protein [Vicinamibacteria bacterium]